MLNDQMLRLAKDSGFVFWDTPGKEKKIDWASNYDVELEVYTNLVIQRCIAEVALIGISNFENDEHGDIGWAVQKAIEMMKRLQE